MKIDRRAFLALASSIAAACTAAPPDDGSTADSLVTGAESPGSPAEESAFCWDPAGPVEEAWGDMIGFDPVASYPAAEAFCLDLPDTLQGGEDPATAAFIYAKCITYAKVYVPLTTYLAFARLQWSPAVHAVDWYANALRVDRQILGSNACVSDAARALCDGRPDRAPCEQLASQLRPERLAALARCLDNGWLAAECANAVGALDD